MKDYQIRVIQEFEDLVEKISKLDRSLQTEFPMINFIIDVDERKLLKLQLRAMRIYSRILADRIEKWRTDFIQVEVV